MDKPLAALYLRLLAHLPPRFRAVFAEEMSQVFRQRVREISSKSAGARLRFFLAEFMALPGLWRLAFRRERGFAMGERHRYAVSAGPAPWGATLLAILPLVGFGVLASLRGSLWPLSALARNGWLRGLGASVLQAGVEPPLLFYLGVLAGFLLAWVKRFPRWSYPYTGWVLVILVFSAGALVRPGELYFRLSWLPFILALLLAVLLVRSFAPLKALWRGWRQDWTLGSLALFAFLEFMVWASFDELPGPREPWQALVLAVLIAGTVWYLRAASSRARLTALLGSATLTVAFSVGVTTYYWQSPSLLPGLLFLVVTLLALLFPGVLASALDRLRPRHSAG